MGDLNFTFEDVLSEIGRLQLRNPDGFSTSDMAIQVDKSEHWCRAQIKKLIKSGKLRFSGMAMRPRIDQRMAAVPIYTVIENSQAVIHG